ncbi:MAG: hypothetical protein OXH38_11835 [Chloroflexi bacterium]|nr:hypothetical protein [Chloroflexota bacterium]
MPARDRNRSPYWLDGIADHDRRSKDWRRGAKSIVRDFAPKFDEAPLYATLWSHAESALPALYAQPPSIVARRRHRDADPDGRLAAEVLQRSASATMEPSGYDEAIGRAVLDLVLVGRGAVCVRYDGEQQPDISVTRRGDEWIAPDGMPVPRQFVVADGPDVGLWVGETTDEIAVVDYIHWSDLAHSNHRTLHELMRHGWIGRRALMTPMAFRRRFGREGKPHPNMTDDDGYGLGTEAGGADDSVLVWEIWDAPSRTRIMLSPGIDELLERRTDPYRLPEFFPFAIVWGSRSNESLVPIADWGQVKKLSDEVEKSSERIGDMIRRLKVRGAYDNSAPQLARILDDDDQDLVGVDTLQALTARGDGTLASLIQFVPTDPIVSALGALYDSRDRSLDSIREIGGFDGGAQSQGTATESRRRQLAAGRRLERRRRKVERFARQAARLLVGVTARLVPSDRLREESAFDLLPEVASKPEGERDADWQRVSDLLKAPSSWRIDVETDSTIETDLLIEERAGFLSAVGDFLRYALPAGQADPELAPALGQLLLFAARTWRAGRSVESVLEEYVARVDARAQQAAAAAQQAAEEPPNEQLSPEEQEQLQELLYRRARLEEEIAALRQRIQIEGVEGALRVRREAARAEAAEQRLDDARFRSAQQRESA